MRPRPLLALLALVLSLLTACADPAVPEGTAGACSTDLDCADGSFCRGGTCAAGGDLCAPLTTCASRCVDLQSDPTHCGACDAPCEGGCVDGACCPAEATLSCGGRCVDPGSDAGHCGGCGQLCGDGLVCAGGACCAPGLTSCEGACRALPEDPYFCGACDVRCPIGAACVGGACAACPAGTTQTTCSGVPLCAPDAGPPGTSCMVEIPAGPFVRGDDVAEGSGPRRTLVLSRFYVDRFEVTRAAYQACVDERGCVPHEDMPIQVEAGPNLPIGWARWGQAEEFCRARGARLPTEAEWEKAARGDDARKYPWGDTEPDCLHANTEGCEGGSVAVGALPDGRSPYEVFELAGNVAEWVDDWYSEDWYASCPEVDPPSPPDVGSRSKLRRGRSFGSPADRVNTYRREPHDLDYSDASGGFRCALTPP